MSRRSRPANGSSSSTPRAAAIWSPWPPAASSTPTPGRSTTTRSSARRRGSSSARPAGPATPSCGRRWPRWSSRCPGAPRSSTRRTWARSSSSPTSSPGPGYSSPGSGSGALSMALLRAGAEVTGYELRPDFAARAQANVAAFLGAGVLDHYRVRGPRRLRRHRRLGLRPDGPGPAGALAAGEIGRGGPPPRRDPGELPADHRPGQHAARRARPQRVRHGRDHRGPPAQLARRRASPCGPTTAWSPTPASSPRPACSRRGRGPKAELPVDLLDLIIVVIALGGGRGRLPAGLPGPGHLVAGPRPLGFYVAIRLLPKVIMRPGRHHRRGCSWRWPSLLLVGGAMIGQAIGLVDRVPAAPGPALRAGAPGGPGRRRGGSASSGSIAALWLLMPSVAAVPGWPARATAGSAISRWVSRTCRPRPTPLQVLRRFISQDAPQVFAVLQPGRQRRTAAHRPARCQPA